jgi:3-hydroxybutyryl-CoA dehydrogenase
VTITPEYNIGIVGCGKMGRDLFDFLADFPFKLILVCKDDQTSQAIHNAFEKKQRRALKYGLINQDFFSFREQNTFISTSLNDLKGSDFVVECISEDPDKKKNLFEELTRIVPKNCILTSNSSSITPDKLFCEHSNKKNCLGLHFFNPVAIKKMVEINLAKETSKSTLAFVKRFLNRIEKKYLVLQDENHFIMNRIFLKMQAGCCHLLYDEEQGTNEIDELIKAHLFPVGVFEFFEHVGYEVMLESVKNYLVYEQASDFYQPLIYYLERKIYEGELGVRIKTGRYKPSVDDPALHRVSASDQAEILDKIYHWYLDGVFDALQRKIGSKDEIKVFVMDYMMVDKSPFELAEEIGYTPK